MKMAEINEDEDALDGDDLDLDEARNSVTFSHKPK